MPLLIIFSTEGLSKAFVMSYCLVSTVVRMINSGIISMGAIEVRYVAKVLRDEVEKMLNTWKQLGDANNVERDLIINGRSIRERFDLDFQSKDPSYQINPR